MRTPSSDRDTDLAAIPNPPAHKERAGAVEAAVWQNDSVDGTTRLRVTLTKTYKVQGHWGRTTTINAEDLPRAIEVLDRCRAWVAEYHLGQAESRTDEVTAAHEKEHEQERDR